MKSAKDAYDLLSDFGATTDSSMADIQRAGMAAQRKRALTPERSQAWRELRDTDKRLALDLLRHHGDPAVFGSVLPELPSTWDLLEELIVDDADPLGPLPPPESFLSDVGPQDKIK